MKKEESGGLLEWIDARLPVSKVWREHLSEYYAPKNFNIWYFFGSLALLAFVMQILTGIFLTMHYKPDAGLAFASIEHIMRDVNWGWLIRYMHSTGASIFFIVVYLHMFRGLLYGSYKNPRELLWLVGMLLYLLLMAEAFTGYLLPWGQMSYWGAQVIVNLFGAIPYIGPDIALWIRGDFVVSDATLNRFFAFHVIVLPLMLIALVFLHIVALHQVGSNNPDGVEIKDNKNEEGVPVDGIPFHPYYTVKDTFGAVAFLLVFALFVFFIPEGGGYVLERDNFIPANPLLTPEHIAPLWYFTPFYTVLRAVPDPWYGVLAMGASIAILFFLPWIDRNPIKSSRNRSVLFRANLLVFVAVFMVLGWLGTKPVNPLNAELAVRFSELYFLFFFVVWFFSRQRSTGVSVLWFFIWMIIVVGYDGARIQPETTTLVSLGALLPLVYLATMLLLPTVSQYGRDGRPPERLT